MIKSLRKILVAATMAFALVANSAVTFAGTTAPTRTISKTPTLAYTLTKLNHNNAIQKFYIGSSYIYITQRVGSTTYLSRCLIKDNNTAEYMDEMTLINCGHGQTLDMYTYNNINYLYVGCKANDADTLYFSLQIARLVYSPNTTYDYTALSRFTYMNYANAAGTSIGTTYRAEAGGNSTYTIFRVQSTTGAIRYSIYDTVKLNQLLDSNSTVQMNTAEVKSACIKSFEQKKSDLTDDYMNNSCQGVDMTGNTDIYITGGVEGDTPKIAHMTNTGNCTTLINVTGVGNHEIEGIQIKDGNAYFVIIPNTTEKTGTQQIYYLPTSAF